MGKIISKRGKEQAAAQEEIIDRIVEGLTDEEIDYDALYDVLPSAQPDDNWYEDWTTSGMTRAQLTWHFAEPADPVAGDATMDLMDQFVNIYTGTRWVRISFVELCEL